jgi:phosphoglucosamine mutase
VKFFGPDGFKLSDDIESEIESLLDSPNLPRPTGVDVGVARLAQNLTRHYYRELFESGANLNGVHAVVDCAFGAAYAVAPYALRKLGATVTEINCENNGARINVACGATDLRPLQAAVRAQIGAGEAHVVGVAFDGDADRVLFVDETGGVVSGDHVMFAIGCDMRARGELAGNAIVGTVMSNIGFERALNAHGIGLIRALVGDRYVLEAMQRGGYTLGGEQSGHIIDFRRNTTGDGPMTAVTLLGIVAATGRRLHDLVADVVIAPQVLVNVRSPRADVIDLPEVRQEIADAEGMLGSAGRLLIRPSGTEPLIRVMAEGDDRVLVEQVAARIAARIEKEVGRLT